MSTEERTLSITLTFSESTYKALSNFLYIPPGEEGNSLFSLLLTLYTIHGIASTLESSTIPLLPGQQEALLNCLSAESKRIRDKCILEIEHSFYKDESEDREEE